MLKARTKVNSDGINRHISRKTNDKNPFLHLFINFSNIHENFAAWLPENHALEN